MSLPSSRSVLLHGAGHIENTAILYIVLLCCRATGRYVTLFTQEAEGTFSTHIVGVTLRN
jgi:hypothetical protein